MFRTHLRPTAAVALAVAVVAVLIAGCGSSSSSTTSSTTASTSASSGGLKANTTPKYAAPAASAPTQSGTVQIAYRNIAINPDTIRVKVGMSSLALRRGVRSHDMFISCICISIDIDRMSPIS